VAANLAIFETSARHGYVTSNRTRDFGAANGYYPIIRLAQLHHYRHLGVRQDVKPPPERGQALH
jgi:hypothetical protein